MIDTKMTVDQFADEAIGMFLELRDQHGYPEPQARLDAVREMIEGIEAEQELRRRRNHATGKIPPIEVINRPIVTCATMTDRAHINRDTAVAFCGRVITGSCRTQGARLCLRCVLESYRATCDHMERQLSNGEY